VPLIPIQGTSLYFQFWDVAESEGGPQVSVAGGSSRVERQVQILPGYMGLARQVFVGYSLLRQPVSGTNKWISRVTPHGYEDEQHLDPEGKPWLWARSVERSRALNVSSISAFSGAPRGLLDLATVVYTDLRYDVVPDTSPLMAFSPDPGGHIDPGTGLIAPPQLNPLIGAPDEATLNRYVTRRYQSLSRTISLPRAIPRWVLEPGDTNYTGSTPGPPVFQGFGRTESGSELQYIWHEVPNFAAGPGSRPEPCVGMPTIGEMLNTVNRYTFDGIYEPGTLLFHKYDMQEERNVRGERVWTITYHFRYLPKYSRVSGLARGHNAYLRAVPRGGPPATDTWLDYRILTLNGRSAGQRTYPSSDFADLFRPEYP
jgi:hypothetical protein